MKNQILCWQVYPGIVNIRIDIVDISIMRVTRGFWRHENQNIYQSILGDLDDAGRHQYESLVSCLSQKFGPRNQTEMYRALLHNRVRQPKESLPDLTHEIRKLVRLAYPPGENMIIDTIALEHFIDALCDPNILNGESNKQDQKRWIKQ